MATTAQRLAALERWKTAHIEGHVLSGHTHGDHQHPNLALASHTHATEPVPPPVEPPPAPPASGIVVPVGKFTSAVTQAAVGSTLSVVSGTHPDTLVRLTASGVSIIGQTPKPLIRPPARPNGLFVQASRTLVAGLDFAGAPGTYNDDQGSALLEVLGEAAPVTDSVLQDIGLDLPAGAASRQACLYLNGDIERLTVRRFVMNGHASQGGRGVGITAWHEAGPNPLRDIVFEDGTLTDFYNPVVFWLPTVGLTFRRVKFVGTLNVDAQFQTGGPVRFEGCTGSKPLIFEAGSTFVDGGGNQLGTVITR